MSPGAEPSATNDICLQDDGSDLWLSAFRERLAIPDNASEHLGTEELQETALPEELMSVDAGSIKISMLPDVVVCRFIY